VFERGKVKREEKMSVVESEKESLRIDKNMTCVQITLRGKKILKSEIVEILSK